MHQYLRGVTGGNINLGNLSGPPTVGDMQFLNERALKFKGRFVEVSWTVPKTGQAFVLTAKIVTKEQPPTWMLYRGSGTSSTLLWGHSSSDITLVNNLVLLECDKDSADSANVISSAAVDKLMDASSASGSMAKGAEDGVSFDAGTSTESDTAAAPLNFSENPFGAESESALHTQEQGTPATQSSFAAQSSEPAPAVEATSEITRSGDVYSTTEVLEGSLFNISIQNLFKFLANKGATGRLCLQGALGAGEIFFVAGAIRHAASLETKGEHALLDLLSWQEGEFHFEPGEQTGLPTMNKDVETFLATAPPLQQYARNLLDIGLRPSAYLLKLENLTRAEFDGASLQDTSIDVYTQWRFYEAIDGCKTLSELLRKCPMTRAEWLILVNHLVKTGLIAITEQPASETREIVLVEPERIDHAIIDAFVESISDPADGILTHSALMYLLQNEFSRFERSSMRLSFMMFSLGHRDSLSGTVVPLAPYLMKEVKARIDRAKRKLDIFGHFELEYALVLPETDSVGAGVFANRILWSLAKPPLGPDVNVVAAFGVATVPDDMADLGTLIAGARVARGRARFTGIPVVSYSDMLSG